MSVKADIQDLGQNWMCAACLGSWRKYLKIIISQRSLTNMILGEKQEPK
jgi:hypothetical protein